MMLRVLTPGCHGQDVARLQQFLAGLELFEGETDGTYDAKYTAAAVRSYRATHKLPPADIADQPTIATMIREGLDVILDAQRESPGPPDWLTPRTKTRQKEDGWGRFTWAPAPVANQIEVERDWIEKNSAVVEAPPELPAFARSEHPIRVHRAILEDFLGLLQDIATAGLGKDILSFDGAMQFRFMRGSRQRLSAHCWGIAFDINSAWNRLGCTPAYEDQKGTVRRIVPLANRRNFWWSGHSRFRRDGAHFEHCQPTKRRP